MRTSIRIYAARYHRLRLCTQDGVISYASELLSDGVRLERADDPGRALSETEAINAIRAGIVVEVVT